MKLLTIIYEDKSILGVYKPAGLPVYPLKPEEENTLAGLLTANFPQLTKVGPLGQAGIIHRLDNNTSGIVIVAKSDTTYQKLKNIWNTNQVKKQYTALVIGNTPATFSIAHPIAHHPSNKKKMMVCETEIKSKTHKARPAITKVETIKHYGGVYSLVNVQIETGVRHQIRVHLASMGFPLAGDKLYQNPSKRKLDCLGLKRQFLHLSEICFLHPETKKIITIKSSLSGDLKSIISLLEKFWQLQVHH